MNLNPKLKAVRPAGVLTSKTYRKPLIATRVSMEALLSDIGMRTGGIIYCRNNQRIQMVVTKSNKESSAWG